MTVFTVPERAPHTDAIIAALRGAGLVVGDGERPNPDEHPNGWQGEPGGSEFIAYTVVHSIPGGTLDGSIGDPHADVTWLWALTSIGAVRQQAERTADIARAVMLGDTGIAVPGRLFVFCTPDNNVGGATRDDAARPPVWFCPDRYQLTTTNP